MAQSLAVGLIASYYALIGVASVLVGILVLGAGVALPLAFGMIPLGVVGALLATTVAIVAFVLGAIGLMLAAGLWHEREWALWIAVAFSAFSLILTLVSWLAVDSVSTLPILGSMVQFPAYEFLIPMVFDIAILGGLLWNRDDFDR